jgi:hypothetical protein
MANRRTFVAPEEVGRKHPTRMGGKQRYHMTDQQRQLLRDKYDGRTATIDRLMPYFPGVPRHTVRRWASMMGLSRNKNRPWTDKEDKYLRSTIHNQRINFIAKKLNRTPIAIRRHAQVMGINKLNRIDGYSIEELSVAFGVSPTTIRRWVNYKWLACQYLRTDRPHDIYIFHDDDIKHFVFSHPDEIDPRKVEWLWLVDILSPNGIGNLTAHKEVVS